MSFINQAPMKFLGEEMYKDLSDSEVRATVSAKFKDLGSKQHMKIVDLYKITR